MTTLLPLTLAGVALAFQLVTSLLALWHMRGHHRAQSPIIGRPAITLLRPVAGSDPLDAKTLASSFAQDWPDYEVVFCAPSEADPAAALVRRLIAEHPDCRARLLTGQSWITGNPKLDNLWKGWHASETAWVCMTDSNLLLPPDYLSTLVASWEPQTGLVSAPACGSAPEGMAGRLECAFLNSGQGRLQLAAAALGFGFAQGKTLFWNRAMLEANGGLSALGRWLAEDVTATKLVRGAGLRVSLPPRLFAQPIGRRRFRQVWERQLRWSRVRRDGYPRAFLLEIANGALLPALLLAATPFATLLPAYLLLWFGAELLLSRRAGWPAAPADLLAMLLRDLMMPAIWAATFASRGISWRGHDLAPPNPAT